MTKVREIVSGKNLYNIFLHLALVASLLVIAVLAKQNRDLKRGSGQAPKANIRAGEYFSLAGLTPATNGAQIDSTSSPQLIFVFTTRCPWCKETLPMWTSLADSASQKSSFAVLGICLDPLEETKTYIMQNQLAFPVFVPKDKEAFSKSNNIGNVPQTFIRTSSGLVEHSYPGKLSPDAYNKILKAITDGIIHKNI